MVFPFVLLVGGLFLISNDMGIIRWYQLRHERNETQLEIADVNADGDINIIDIVTLVGIIIGD